jgi:hypothetical protein
MDSVPLVCHPATPCEALRRVEVRARRTSDATLELLYCLEGDIPAVLFPAERAPCRADELWRHTCLEAFVAAEDAGYYEINFSPSTEWAVYRFNAYRKGMAVVQAACSPRISVRRAAAQRWSLSAELDLASLHSLERTSRPRLALSAVIEQVDGRLSYWALAHPVGKPDFHHAAGFVLAMPQLDRAASRGRPE